MKICISVSFDKIEKFENFRKKNVTQCTSDNTNKVIFCLYAECIVSCADCLKNFTIFFDSILIHISPKKQANELNMRTNKHIHCAIAAIPYRNKRQQWG